MDNERDGLCIGVTDLDEDGRLDLVQANADQSPILYKNVSETAGHWLELNLIGTKSNRDGVGARVQWPVGLLRSGNLTVGMDMQARAAGGYILESGRPKRLIGCKSAGLVGE